MAYSQLQYGILAWGNAKNNLSTLNKVHNRIIKMIQENFQTNLLSIEQIYKLEIGKFMFRYNANQLPTSFIKYFISIESIHSYLTRLSKQQNYFLPRYRLQQSQKLISYTGAKLWSEIPKNIKNFPTKIFLKN